MFTKIFVAKNSENTKIFIVHLSENTTFVASNNNNGVPITHFFESNNIRVPPWMSHVLHTQPFILNLIALESSRCPQHGLRLLLQRANADLVALPLDFVERGTI